MEILHKIGTSFFGRISYKKPFFLGEAHKTWTSMSVLCLMDCTIAE